MPPLGLIINIIINISDSDSYALSGPRWSIIWDFDPQNPRLLTTLDPRGHSYAPFTTTGTTPSTNTSICSSYYYYNFHYY